MIYAALLSVNHGGRGRGYLAGASNSRMVRCISLLAVLIDRQSIEADTQMRKQLVWEIERKLAEDGARPIVFYDRRATCWQHHVNGYTVMVNSIFNGWRIDTSGSTNKRANAVQRRTVFEQDLLAVTNVWGRPALPNSSSPPKVRREIIAELCHLPKSVHAGLRRAVDEIAQEGMRALASMSLWP